MLAFNKSAFANDHCALKRIAQFPDIARPGITLENVEHRLADVRNFAFVLLVHLREQERTSSRRSSL